MLQWVGPFNSGAAVGNAGVATANADSPIRLTGKVHAISVKYNDSPPAATTDVTIATKGASPHVPAITLLNKANSATDAIYYPRVLAQGTNGADLAGWYDTLAIDDYVNVKIDQANANDNVDIWLCLER